MHNCCENACLESVGNSCCMWLVLRVILGWICEGVVVNLCWSLRGVFRGCFEVGFGGRKVTGKGPWTCESTAPKQGKCRVRCRPFWPGSKVHVQTYEFIRPDVGHSAQFLGDVVCTSGRMGGYVRT